METFISRILMIMNHERSHNDQLREQYINWCIEKPLDFQTTVMKKLQDIGYLKKENPRHLALEYYSPVYLFFNQYMNHDYTEKDTEHFKQAVMSAAGSFLQTYRKEN